MASPARVPSRSADAMPRPWSGRLESNPLDSSLLERAKIKASLGAGSNAAVLSAIFQEAATHSGARAGAATPAPGFVPINRKVALKVMSHFWDENAKKLLDCERHTLEHLPPHPGVIRVFKQFISALPAHVVPYLTTDMQVAWKAAADPRSSPTTQCFIMEYHPATLDRWRQMFPVPMPWHILWRLSRDLVAVGAHMQAHNCAHLDLKLDNILIGYDGRCVLTDFGISRVFPAGSGMRIQYKEPFGLLMNRLVLAPEVLQAHEAAKDTVRRYKKALREWEKAGDKSVPAPVEPSPDSASLTLPFAAQLSWSIGVVLYELASGFAHEPSYPDDGGGVRGNRYTLAGMPPLPCAAEELAEEEQDASQVAGEGIEGSDTDTEPSFTSAEASGEGGAARPKAQHQQRVRVRKSSSKGGVCSYGIGHIRMLQASDGSFRWSHSTDGGSDSGTGYPAAFCGLIAAMCDSEPATRVSVEDALAVLDLLKPTYEVHVSATAGSSSSEPSDSNSTGLVLPDGRSFTFPADVPVLVPGPPPRSYPAADVDGDTSGTQGGEEEEEEVDGDAAASHFAAVEGTGDALIIPVLLRHCSGHARILRCAADTALEQVIDAWRSDASCVLPCFISGGAGAAAAPDDSEIGSCRVWMGGFEAHNSTTAGACVAYLLPPEHDLIGGAAAAAAAAAAASPARAVGGRPSTIAEEGETEAEAAAAAADGDDDGDVTPDDRWTDDDDVDDDEEAEAEAEAGADEDADGSGSSAAAASASSTPRAGGAAASKAQKRGGRRRANKRKQRNCKKNASSTTAAATAARGSKRDRKDSSSSSRQQQASAAEPSSPQSPGKSSVISVASSIGGAAHLLTADTVTAALAATGGFLILDLAPSEEETIVQCANVFVQTAEAVCDEGAEVISGAPPQPLWVRGDDAAHPLLSLAHALPLAASSDVPLLPMQHREGGGTLSVSAQRAQAVLEWCRSYRLLQGAAPLPAATASTKAHQSMLAAVATQRVLRSHAPITVDMREAILYRVLLVLTGWCNTALKDSNIPFPYVRSALAAIRAATWFKHHHETVAAAVGLLRNVSCTEDLDHASAMVASGALEACCEAYFASWLPHATVDEKQRAARSQGQGNNIGNRNSSSRTSDGGISVLVNGSEQARDSKDSRGCELKDKEQKEKHHGCDTRVAEDCLLAVSNLLRFDELQRPTVPYTRCAEMVVDALRIAGASVEPTAKAGTTGTGGTGAAPAVSASALAAAHTIFDSGVRLLKYLLGGDEEMVALAVASAGTLDVLTLALRLFPSESSTVETCLHVICSLLVYDANRTARVCPYKACGEAVVAILSKPEYADDVSILGLGATALRNLACVTLDPADTATAAAAASPAAAATAGGTGAEPLPTTVSPALVIAQAGAAAVLEDAMSRHPTVHAIQENGRCALYNLLLIGANDAKGMYDRAAALSSELQELRAQMKALKAAAAAASAHAASAAVPSKGEATDAGAASSSAAAAAAATGLLNTSGSSAVEAAGEPLEQSRRAAVLTRGTSDGGSSTSMLGSILTSVSPVVSPPAAAAAAAAASAFTADPAAAASASAASAASVRSGSYDAAAVAAASASSGHVPVLAPALPPLPPATATATTATAATTTTSDGSELAVTVPSSTFNTMASARGAMFSACGDEAVLVWDEEDGARLRALDLDAIHLAVTPHKPGIAAAATTPGTDVTDTAITLGPGAASPAPVQSPTVGYSGGALPVPTVLPPSAAALLRNARVPIQSTMPPPGGGFGRAGSTLDAAAVTDWRSSFSPPNRRGGSGSGSSGASSGGGGGGGGAWSVVCCSRLWAREQATFAFWLVLVLLLGAVGAAVAGFMT